MRNRLRTSLKHGLQMLTIRQAAAELRITPRRVQGCMRSGKLPHFSLTDDGKTIRIIRCDLRTYAIRHRWQLRCFQTLAIIAAMVTTAGTGR